MTTAGYEMKNKKAQAGSLGLYYFYLFLYGSGGRI
jgi:hypothetical protein